jgi:hypothetical protein
MRDVPTIGRLRQQCSWIWIHCCNRHCLRAQPTALAPLIIRLGPDASSDIIRARARCAACGHRGATITLPSWASRATGEMPFPVHART